MSNVTVVSQSQASRAMANELNDLRERWLIRKQIEAETLGEKLSIADVDHAVMLSGDNLFETYNQIVQEADAIQSHLSDLAKAKGIRAKVRRDALIVELTYKRALQRAFKHTAYLKRKSVKKPKPVKTTPTAAELLANVTGPDKLIGDAWQLLKSLARDNRVIYSTEEQGLVDMLRAWLRQQGHIPGFDYGLREAEPGNGQNGA